jgi:quercetin dioxygenase-like cupin family protein
MIETVYEYTKTDSKLIERIVDDLNTAINHMVLNKGEALPIHDANSHVYLLILRGKLDSSSRSGCPHI